MRMFPRARARRWSLLGALGVSTAVLVGAPAYARALAVGDAPVAAAASKAPPEPLTHPWRMIDGKHWQIESTDVEDVAMTDAAEGTRGACPPGMVEVEGRMKVGGWGWEDAVDALQRQACVDWIDRAFPERCARYDRDRWLALSSRLPVRPMHFCIDRFEYPNRRGAYPWIMVSWTEARALCAEQGKRLCTEAEWTFACEGEEAMPYPYGYVRDADACVIDRPWRPVDAAALAPRDGERALVELDRLWQGDASGSHPRCRSAFGVYDMTGNVDEWTESVVPGEHPSILKGGYWGPVRTRCRPSTRVHGPDFTFYQQGFRCCADAPAPR
jgi:sulfatase modifying factor 1